MAGRTDEPTISRFAAGVLPAVQRMVEPGIADENRLAVMGQSLGGHTVYSLVTKTTPFKAAIAAPLASNPKPVRLSCMKDMIAALTQRMEAAAAALDYEEARRCRDMISLMRGGATVEEAASADVSGLERPKPGAMGLGTSQQKVVPPPNWKPPVKPDLMTTGRRSRGGKRK